MQTSTDFLVIILDENNEVKVCGFDCKSRLMHSTQQHSVAQFMSGSGVYSKVKWNDESLNYHVPIFHEKFQILHHAVAHYLDIILLLVGRQNLNIKLFREILRFSNYGLQEIVAEP